MFILIFLIINGFIFPIQTEIPPVEELPYPTYSYIPETRFDCNNRWGFYADPETSCQVFHLCKYSSKISASFLCTNGTLFQQNHPQRCDHWYKVKCTQKIYIAFYIFNASCINFIRIIFINNCLIKQAFIFRCVFNEYAFSFHFLFLYLASVLLFNFTRLPNIFNAICLYHKCQQKIVIPWNVFRLFYMILA